LIEWRSIIDRACNLIRAYNTQGIRPTLRQVHYRLASEQVGGYQNTKACYKTLSEKLVKARMNRLIPWSALADHVRYTWWFKPQGLVSSASMLSSTSFLFFRYGNICLRSWMTDSFPCILAS